MKKYLIYLFLLCTILYGEGNVSKVIDVNITKEKIVQDRQKEKRLSKIKALLKDKQMLDIDLNTNNIWLKVYSNYDTYS